VTGSGAPAELRDPVTIRAYLEELARTRAQVRLWRDGTGEGAFVTTLQQVAPTTFSTTTTPQLEPGQVVNFAFMLDARRFTTRGQAVAPGVFRMPFSVAQGERRAAFRGPFERSERVRVLAVETVAGTLLGGRLALGRLADLSTGGLGLLLDELDVPEGLPADLRPGDRFAAVHISNLPFTPDLQCQATVIHAAAADLETRVGLRLEGLSDRDRTTIERLLIPRFPATFGEAFPARKRKTDLADQPGPPTSTLARAKAPEVLDQALAGPEAPTAPVRPQPGPVARLRRAAKKILVLSAHPGAAQVLEAFHQDGFRQAVRADSYQRARLLAEQGRYDLLVADLKVGTRWTKDLMAALADHGLLQGLPTILLVDYPHEGGSAMARPLGAVHVHVRDQGAGALVDAACALLGVE
jgi:hypothetical protein